MAEALEALEIEKDSSVVSVERSRHEEATPNTLIATPEPMMFPGEYKTESDEGRGETDTSSQTKVTGVLERSSSGADQLDAGSSKSTRVAPRKPRSKPLDNPRATVRRLTPSGATNVITARSKRDRRNKVRSVTRDPSSVLSSVVFPKDRTGWIAVVLFLGTIAVGAAFGFGWLGGGDSETESNAPQVATSPPLADTELAADEVVTTTPPEVNPEEQTLAMTHTLQLAVAVVGDAVPQTRAIRFGGTPDMTVSHGDREIGETPFDLVLPSLQASVQLTFARRGYSPVVQQVAYDQNEVSVVLERRSRRDGSHRRGDRGSESGDQNSETEERQSEEPPALPFGRVGVEGGG